MNFPDSSNELLPKNPAEELLSSDDWMLVAARLRLSTRERSVAILMFEGKTRAQIASRLECSSGTVRVYIDRLFAKLNVENRVAMVLRVVRVHLEIKAVCSERSCRTKVRLAGRTNPFSLDVRLLSRLWEATSGGPFTSHTGAKPVQEGQRR